MHNIDTNQYHEVLIPATHETFEAQVLVSTVSRNEKRPVYMYNVPLVTIGAEETRRVIRSGRYRLELVEPAYAGGKPTLIIREEEHEQA